MRICRLEQVKSDIIKTSALRIKEMDINKTSEEIISEFTQKEKTLKDMGASINSLLNTLMKKIK